MIEESGIASQA